MLALRSEAVAAALAAVVGIAAAVVFGENFFKRDGASLRPGGGSCRPSGYSQVPWRFKYVLRGGFLSAQRWL